VPAVTVRYWAAARAAAGVAEERLAGDTLGDVLIAARLAHGEQLGRVLARCSYLVDAVRARPDTLVTEGSVIEVLPPFAGGAPADAHASAPATRARVAGWPVVALCPPLAAGGLLAASLGPGPLTAWVAALQALLLAGWFRLFRVPGVGHGIVVAGAAGAVADVLLLVRETEPPLEPVAWVLGPALLAALVAQLLRRPARDDVVTSMTATVTATLVVVGGVWLIPALRLGSTVGTTLGSNTAPEAGAAAVAGGLVGAGVATAVAALGSARRASFEGRSLSARIALGLLAGALAGWAAGELSPAAAAWNGAGALGSAAGSAAAALALAGQRLATAPARDPGTAAADGAARALVAASLPLLLAGPPAYLLGRLLGG